ncbi:MAG TPA: hypothetical protein VFQ27_06270 [Xanthobacteraceae bacterium]|nr:hypothetical protein [Xanthobacteraceae bacterium]
MSTGAPVGLEPWAGVPRLPPNATAEQERTEKQLPAARRLKPRFHKVRKSKEKGMTAAHENEPRLRFIESEADARAASSLLPMLIGGLVLTIIGMLFVVIFA